MSISKGTTFSTSFDPLPESPTDKDYESFNFTEVGEVTELPDSNKCVSICYKKGDKTKLTLGIESCYGTGDSIEINKEKALNMAQSIIDLYK